jgi:hypothetical protein
MNFTPENQITITKINSRIDFIKFLIGTGRYSTIESSKLYEHIVENLPYNCDDIYGVNFQTAIDEKIIEAKVETMYRDERYILITQEEYNQRLQEEKDLIEARKWQDSLPEKQKKYIELIVKSSIVGPAFC